MMDPKDNQFRAPTPDEAAFLEQLEAGMRSIGSKFDGLEAALNDASATLGMPVFQVGEEIPLRGYRWRVKEMRGAELILEGVGPTEKAARR